MKRFLLLLLLALPLQAQVVTIDNGTMPTERGKINANFTYLSSNRENLLTFSTGLLRTTNAITCILASGSALGCLSATDWNTFNGKQAALGFTPENVLTFGAGLNRSTNTITTDSSTQNFLKSGALTCGASTAGKMQVHTTALQYCDNAGTPTLQYAAYGSSAGVATSAAALSAAYIDWNASSGGTFIQNKPTTFAPAAHNLLSASHGDTTAASAVRGDGLFAIGATPTWQRLAHPATSGGYFKWNGTDIVASTNAAAGTGACTNGMVVTENADAAPTCTGADTTTTHALFATAGAPAFRAIAAGDLPAALASSTSVNGTTIPSSSTLITSGGALGTPSSGTGTNLTGIPIGSGISGLAAGVAAFAAAPSGANFNSMITGGGVEIPQNSKSTAYTTVLADCEHSIYHPGADTTARTWTIDSNANVAAPIGCTITFVNDTSAGVLTIAITTDTLVLAGAGTTGSRTLAASGIATATKITSTRWMINGSGLT